MDERLQRAFAEARQPVPGLATQRVSATSETASEEEGVTVASGVPAAPSGTAGVPPASSGFDDDGPPLEVLAADEAGASQPGLAGASMPPSARLRTPEADEDRLPAPPLDALVGRIPTNVRELMDDLFRARFVRVTRVPLSTLKER